MILQALNDHYQILLKDPDTQIAPPGFSNVPVHLAIILDSDGCFLGLTSLMNEEQRGKLKVEVATRLFVPEQIIRAGTKISPNFLCDRTAYVLGISNRDETQPAYSKDRHQAFKTFNLSLLSGIENTPAVAVSKFLKSYDPDEFRNSLEYQNHADLLNIANLVFKIIGDEGFIHENLVIKQAWIKHLQSTSEAPIGQCLLTGEISPIELTHAKIKGVPGGQSSGTAIVSFNERAYESFNRTNQQGLNAPISKTAVFGYTTALNYLLRSPQNRINLNDTTVVFWAESSEKHFENIYNAILNPDPQPKSNQKNTRDHADEQILLSILANIKKGEPVDQAALKELIKENPRFHVLGISPNSARLSIRFYYNDPFLKAVNHLLQHHQDMLIIKEFEKDQDFFSVFRIIRETVSPIAKNRDPAPLLTGALLRAILMNTPYPAALYSAILIRIRADQDNKDKNVKKINHLRAAIIKAYLSRKFRNLNIYKEELQMSLNKDSTNQAYLLGRLFAVLEKAQIDALGKKLNTTIKDRYFTSACATPATTFPILLRLSQHHISKSDYGYFRDREIQDIMEKLEVNKNPFPKHLNLDEQGIFVLGYYHQKADFFKVNSQNEIPNPEEK